MRAQETKEEKDVVRELKGMSLEEIANLEVTSVSKKSEKRTQVAAAIHVVTQEDIRRSGATNLPDLLRMVPGVQVAQVDSNKWAVGIRGFGSRLARSMLVLVDGRSVYTPLFAGVYWEVQDMLLEDIEQIEVIRGPGGTIWGANAVNGVVNIIRKNSQDTQGGLLVVGGGSHEQGFTSFRYGGSIKNRYPYRVYGKLFNRGPGFHSTTGNFDDWRMGQAGFRTDWQPPSSHKWTLQGDVYVGRTGQRSQVTILSPPSRQFLEGDAELSGGNVLGRWRYAPSSTSEMTMQTYYDHTNRQELSFEETRDTFDVDFHQRFSLARRHELNWGLGYRVSSGKFTALPSLVFVPARRTDHLYTAFLQDEITLLRNQIRVTLGSKFERNGYSGFEYQPSARISWTPTPANTVWMAVSRAVRTPSRIEHDFLATTFISAAPLTFSRFLGNKGFESEEIVSYELGYRLRVKEDFLLGFASFYNDYEDLFSIEPGVPFVETTPPPPRTILPFTFGNGLDGRVYGFEVTPEWVVLPRWRLSGSYSYVRLNLRKEAGSLDSAAGVSTEGSSPRHQFVLRSLMNLPKRLELDLTFRFVDDLPAQQVQSYSTLDARMSWRAAEKLEVSIVGRNLLQEHHAEFGGGSGGLTEVRRSVYGKMTWQW